ncbi:MAG: tetratricopeptide repeat protein, partial [Planctomycetota bacterium]|nr:tetratricopeptide repeat protein [Planctomycetota bacterium]
RAKERLEVIRRQLGTTDVSLEDLQTEIERDPKNVRARLKLGRLYESLGRYEDAVEQVEALLDLAPYHPEVYVLARDVQSRLGNRAAVIESLRKEVALKRTHYEKVRLLYRLGNYLELEGREEEAIEVWMQMKGPGRVQFGGRRAHLFIAKWRDDLADQVLQDQGTGGETAARMALFQGRVEEAVDRLYEIHRARPLDLEGFIKPSPRGADVFRWTLDPEDLAGPLRRRAEKTPDDARGWILLAVVLQGSLQYDKAIEALEKAHEASPHSREILQMLVEICDGAGAWEKGVTYAERLLPIIPSEDAVEPNRRRHRRPYAEDLERESVVDYLARFHRLAGRPEDAREAIRRLGSGDAAAGSPRIAELLSTHGFYEEAARELGLHLPPNRNGEVSLYEKLAEYLVLSGQPEKAKALLRERLTGEDDSEVGTRAIERIDRAMMDWPKVSPPEAARQDGHGPGLEVLLARAREAQRRGQIREAAEILALAAERHPSEKEPLLRLYDLHREEGEPAEAITALERLFEKFPSERQSLSTQLAHLYLRLGEISRALEAWKVARPDAPEDDVRFRLGKELQQRGRSRLAAEEYREAIRLAGSPSAREEYEEALNAITPSPEDAVKTFEQFSQALKRGPQSGAPFGWEEGLRYLSRQEPVRARVAEAEAIPPGERSKEDAWWVWASALFGDDTEKAKRELRTHLARFPDDIDAWRALSMALGWIGDRDGILEAYLGWKGAEERREGEVGWIWDRMGDLHFREGRKEDAIRCWRMAVRVGRAPLFEFGRGRGRGIDHGRYLMKLLRNSLEEEALQESARALALGIVKPHEALTTMAAISFRRGDFEKALRYSVDTGATWIIGGTSMGRLAKRTEHRDRVLKLLDYQLRHRWTDRRLLDDFTRMVERIEEPELALPYLEAALERTPDDLSLQFQIGMALAMAERYDEARTVLEDLWRRIVLSGGKATYRFQTEGRRGSGSGGSMGHSLDTSQVGIQLASVYESLGMIAEAESLRGHMPSSQDGYAAVDLSSNAWELQKKGRYQEALRAVRRQLVNLAPPVHAGPFAHHQEQSLLGMELSLLRRLSRMDEAASRARDLIELHRGSIQLRPWEARSHSEIASIRSQYTREWDAALDGIETARDLLPHESWPVEEKAFILLRMGRIEEAGGVFAEAEAIRLRRGGEIEGAPLLGRAIVA